MSSPEFVHLHVHTEYSLVDSTVRIPKLMQACVEQGMPAVALTDQNNLFGLVKFYRKAIAAGIKPVIGLDLRILNEDEPDRPYTLLLLVQDNDGYRKLSELVTRCYIEGQIRGEPMARREWLTEESCAGLIALSGGLHSDIGHALHSNHWLIRRAQLLDGWRTIFPGRFYLELIRTGRAGEEDCVRASLELASVTGTPVVASNDVRFLSPDDFNAHEARVCIHDSRVLADSDRPRTYSTQQYLRAPGEMAELFADVPEALINTVEIARRCNLDLQLGESVLPAFPVPDGQNEAKFLEDEAKRGLEAALDRIYAAREIPEKERAAFSAPYFERLDIELGGHPVDGLPGLLPDRCGLYSLGA